MPDYLTPGYRNSDEGRPVWKRPAFLIIVVLVVIVLVVGAAFFFSSEEASGSGGSGSSDGGLTADERADVTTAGPWRSAHP